MPPELQIGARAWSWVSSADVLRLEQLPASELTLGRYQGAFVPDLAATDASANDAALTQQELSDAP